MKGSLLLSLGLLVVLLAASVPSTAQGDPDKETQSTETTQSTSTATQSTETTQSTSTATQSTETTQSTSTATQSTETTQSTSTATQSSETTQSTSTATQSSETTQSTSTATQSSGTTQSDSTPTQSSGTTQSPGVSSQTITPGFHDPCETNPCGAPASCVSLHSEHVCLCSEGYYYQTSTCIKGKTFPGELTTKVTQSPDLEDKNSAVYQDFHNYVLEFFGKTLNKSNYDYGQTIILKVSDSPLSARSAMRAAEKTVYVSVVNMFGENTAQNESTISAVIKKAIENNANITGYSGQDLCDYYNCEKNADSCQNGLNCKCKPGWEKLNLVTPFCVRTSVPAQVCPETCKAEDKKQCLVKGNGTPECVCMPGYQKTTDEKCEECPFGYSGMDCKDEFRLILTIVGTIAGALILILLITLIVSMSSKKKRKNVEEQNLIENDFHSVRLQQTGFSNSGFSNFGADNSIFPKVRTGTPGQTQNPYANQRSMPRPDY
ncbi:hypothetical protein STEG23_025585 [Scotinomys teguina]